MQPNKINLINCDIAVIGAGSGGLSIAAGAAQLGAKTILIEANKMGGDCLNTGCVPSKTLLAIAKNYHAAKQALFISTPQELSVDFSAVMQQVQNVIHTIAEHDSIERFEALGVKVILAKAKFINSGTIQAGKYHIHAKRFIIATGSVPFIPPITGLNKVNYLTNETIFTLKQLPNHLIVIGGGPIGCELAQAFALLGSRVTLLEALTLLPKDEIDCVDIVKTMLKKTGVNYHETVQIENIQTISNGVTVHVKIAGNKLDFIGSHLLIATGRQANVQDLGLIEADIDYTKKGIKVDTRLRTTNRRVFAIGDAAGSFQFTHVANYHAGIVIKNALFRWPAKVNYRAVPWVTYTEPELAHVGLLSKDAKKQGLSFQITEWPFSENDRAQTEGKISGKIKILTNNKSKVLGVTIVGPQAGELILPWVMVIREGKTLRSFTDAIVPYPTLAEISKRAAGAFYTPKLFSSKIKKLVKWLLWFG